MRLLSIKDFTNTKQLENERLAKEASILTNYIAKKTQELNTTVVDYDDKQEKERRKFDQFVIELNNKKSKLLMKLSEVESKVYQAYSSIDMIKSGAERNVNEKRAADLEKMAERLTQEKKDIERLRGEQNDLMGILSRKLSDATSEKELLLKKELELEKTENEIAQFRKDVIQQTNEYKMLVSHKDGELESAHKRNRDEQKCIDISKKEIEDYREQFLLEKMEFENEKQDLSIHIADFETKKKVFAAEMARSNKESTDLRKEIESSYEQMIRDKEVSTKMLQNASNIEAELNKERGELADSLQENKILKESLENGWEENTQQKIKLLDERQTLDRAWAELRVKQQKYGATS